ncbi:MAG: Gfo/Idh/MocA family oxidoreductase [Kiritimatiellae bacterium]|jgi:predicted dehydrogenase|nr:Gfo/Idh/MocA family oxidoreductase [Kiritimatiellia bacterium]
MNNTWKFVLVGCGGIADAWLSVCANLENARIVGLVDLHESAARAKADKFALTDTHIGTDLDAMLRELRPDVVFDCTVPPAHHQVVLTALSHGCHVFGEKPLANTMDQAREMVAAAEQSGKIYGVMQNRRWLSGIQRVRQALDNNVIGRVHTLHSDFFIGAHFGGFREDMKHVLLLDMAIHSFDQARYLIAPLPLSVIAAEWNPPGSWYNHHASAMACFELEEHCAFSYRGSWCAEGLNTPWECAWRIIGDRGSLLWDGGENVQAEVVGQADGFIRPTLPVKIPSFSLPKERTGHGSAIHDFLESLDQNRSPATPASDNIHSLAMVHAAIHSAETGQRVRLDQI